MALGLLDKERKGSSFNCDEIKPLLFEYTYPEIDVSRREFLKKLLEQEPELYPSMTRYIEERSARTNSMFKYGHKLQQIIQKLDLSEPEISYIILKYGEQTPFSVHFSIFLPALKLLASSKQRKNVIHQAEKLKFLGCYAQTELAHTPYNRQIETTAEFDQESQEFIINTPTPRSYK